MTAEARSHTARLIAEDRDESELTVPWPSGRECRDHWVQVQGVLEMITKIYHPGDPLPNRWALRSCKPQPCRCLCPGCGQLRAANVWERDYHTWCNKEGSGELPERDR